MALCYEFKNFSYWLGCLGSLVADMAETLPTTSCSCQSLFLLFAKSSPMAGVPFHPGNFIGSNSALFAGQALGDIYSVDFFAPAGSTSS